MAPPKNQIDKTNLPALAQYRSIADYIPSHGDYIVWSGWFTTWHGLLADYDRDTDTISIIFAGVPFVLLTLNEAEQEKDTKKIKLNNIKLSSHGKWAIMQLDTSRSTNVWFI